MSGNAEEITCIDKDCDTYVRKGGSLMFGQSQAKILSAYSYEISNQNTSIFTLGFRLVKDIE